MIFQISNAHQTDNNNSEKIKIKGVDQNEKIALDYF